MLSEQLFCKSKILLKRINSLKNLLIAKKKREEEYICIHRAHV